MKIKAVDLFQAYTQNKLPQDGGYIVSSLFDSHSAYAKLEIVAYRNARAIFFSTEGLSFQTDGNKLYMLVEPPDYEYRDEEPFRRTREKQIPHRFSELNIIQTKNRTRVMVSKKPVMVYSSFVVLKPTHDDFAFIFYHQPEVLDTLLIFLEQTLQKECSITEDDVKKITSLIVQSLNKFTVWNT
ncbi:MAG: hypothetical protein JW822_10355 [Spirochaetales bacterium]|nr:hypothetical protein [Spirochaetales bacterium]